jgi:protein-disulfide isomerase
MVEQYGGKMRVVYKNYVVHPDTVMDAHLAGCAAAKQGKFKEFKYAFWEKGFREYAKTRDPKVMAKDAIMKIAGDAKIDTARLGTDMASAECKQRISSDMAELGKFGVNGTPAFFVNGKYTMFSGPEAFKALIDSELEAVTKSGIPPEEYYQKVVMAGEKKFKSRKGS